MGKPCWYNMLGRRGGVSVSPEIPDLAAHQDERGQMTVGGWRVGVGGDVTWRFMWLAHVVDAMPRWGCGGGDVNVPCDLLTLLMLRHAGVGVGGDVNVPCDLLSLLMLRHAGVGVGGMLTFHVTCSRCWCYATLGLGWGGMLTFHVTCSRCWCYATLGLGWGGC